MCINKHGYKHITEGHVTEWEQLNIPPEKLPEPAEAATTMGYPYKDQRANRPIFTLTFYGTPVLVGVTVSARGFVVGMNRSSKAEFMSEKKITEKEFRELGIWPIEGDHEAWVTSVRACLSKGW